LAHWARFSTAPADDKENSAGRHKKKDKGVQMKTVFEELSREEEKMSGRWEVDGEREGIGIGWGKERSKELLLRGQ
jgi:hypothetical protein